MSTEVLFEDLSRARRLLATSPLVPSLKLALTPLASAVEILRDPSGLLPADLERLKHEISAIGQLMGGMEAWLSARGALSPTYDRHAGVDVGSQRANFAVEG